MIHFKELARPTIKQVDAGYWFEVDEKRCNGGVLLAHGLNMNPVSWQEMIGFLNQLGLSVYRLELKGHRGLDYSDMVDVSAKIWLTQFGSALDYMQGKLPKSKIYFVGYSLGALLGTVYQLQQCSPCFERQVLMAPALAPKVYTRLALPLSRVVPTLVSRSARRYVANEKGATRAAYVALFELEKEIRLVKSWQMSAVNYPTLIIMRPNDELISYRGLLELIRKRKLANWSLSELPRKKKTHLYLSLRHLIVDEQSVGERSWQKLTALLNEFLLAGDEVGEVARRD